MQNAKPKKSLRRGLVTKGILVLLSLIILFFVISYAWFYDKTNEASASGISVKTTAGNNYEVAIGFKNSQTGGAYKVSSFTDYSNVDLLLDQLHVDGDNTVYNLFKDYTPIDVTGNGSTLIRPAMVYMNSDVDTTSNNYSIAIPNVQYISFDLILRSKDSGSVTLTKDSWVKGYWETLNSSNVLNPSTLPSDQLFNVSKYSADNSSSSDPSYQLHPFSRDAIVGSSRISFVNFDENLTASNVLEDTDEYLKELPTLLWNPRPELCLNPNFDNQNNELTYGWTLSSNKSKGNTDGFKGFDTYKQVFYDIFENNNHNFVDYETKYSQEITDGETTYISAQPNDNVFCSLNLTNTDYTYGKVKVNIWVEGCDKEARRATSNGTFKFHFDLSSK